MANNKGKNIPSIPNQNKFKGTPPVKSAVGEVYNMMQQGREFESLIVKKPSFDVVPELRYAMAEIAKIRNRTVIGYCTNVINPNITASVSVDPQDELPFSEMLASIPADVKEIDIILVTPGGSGAQIAKFVDRLRPRFDHVTFILPNIAMSAGTIFVMSGDDIIMDERAYIGPIDPQVRNKDGQYVPAQSILTLIKDIQSRGEPLIKAGQNPPWTDMQILNKLDAKDIGTAITASSYSVELVENYLNDYKFKSWVKHSDGRPVTPDERRKTAKRVAEMLCDHSVWKSHSRGITRETARSICGLKIIHSESITGLNLAIRKCWALLHWTFENTKVSKIFISNNYCILKQDKSAT